MEWPNLSTLSTLKFNILKVSSDFKRLFLIFTIAQFLL